MSNDTPFSFSLPGGESSKRKRRESNENENAGQFESPFAHPRPLVERVNAELINTTTLQLLHTDEQRKVMDTVDQLRRIGLNGVIQLPQLVVCGDQSSGKSSVLEAITEIPFPRKENLCTRFATEIILRRDSTSSIATKIIPDRRKPVMEQQRLRAFRKSIRNFSELPSLIDEATKLMGLASSEPGKTRAFSRDVLSVEICGPQRPQLTLVDLPGLIHTENKVQSKQDVQLIRELVNEYISNERTIILAIVSAKNDYANQIILDDCRRVDKEGARTLGIITKPDFLRQGSANEQTWIDLALNKDIYFELGWHMLKNRADDDFSTFHERNESETVFFSRGKYRELSQSMVGIGSLRVRLSQLLEKHLSKELPHLQQELEKKLLDTNQELLNLGSKRSTLAEKRQYLTGISMNVHELLKYGVDGHYEGPFFDQTDSEGPLFDRTVSEGPSRVLTVRRFRAMIQALNIEFARDMRICGRKYHITNRLIRDEDDVESDDLKVQLPQLTQMPPPRPSKVLSHDEAITWVMEALQRSRGRELPGNFNPMLIAQLFWEQSEPWEKIALRHIDKVAKACRLFVSDVLEYSAPGVLHSRLLKHQVETELESALEASKRELALIVKDKRGYPMTYNHYYTTTIQKIRHERHASRVREAAEAAKTRVANYSNQHYVQKEYLDPVILDQRLDANIEQNMDRFSAEDALSCQVAFYKDEMKYFIGVVPKQCIERHLVATLSSNILSPLQIAGLSDEEVKFLAAEPNETSQKRGFLEGRQKMLKNGLEIFNAATGRIM